MHVQALKKARTFEVLKIQRRIKEAAAAGTTAEAGTPGGKGTPSKGQIAATATSDPLGGVTAAADSNTHHHHTVALDKLRSQLEAAKGVDLDLLALQAAQRCGMLQKPPSVAPGQQDDHGEDQAPGKLAADVKATMAPNPGALGNGGGLHQQAEVRTGGGWAINRCLASMITELEAGSDINGNCLLQDARLDWNLISFAWELIDGIYMFPAPCRSFMLVCSRRVLSGKNS